MLVLVLRQGSHSSLLKSALEWLKMNVSRLPCLTEIARRLLCVSASSTAKK